MYYKILVIQIGVQRYIRQLKGTLLCWNPQGYYCLRQSKKMCCWQGIIFVFCVGLSITPLLKVYRISITIQRSLYLRVVCSFLSKINTTLFTKEIGLLKKEKASFHSLFVFSTTVKEL